MSDYDLSGLSTRSFEKLIQSIAGKVLGPGTVTYGDGLNELLKGTSGKAREVVVGHCCRSYNALFLA